MIDVVIGSLSEQQCEGVVCPVRSDLTPLTAGARDILLGAGQAVSEVASRMGALPLGGAFVTPGGDLPASYIIHTVTASEDEPETLHSIQRALRNALRRAADLGMVSVTIPPLGLGVGQLEAEDAARAMVEIFVEHLGEGGVPDALTIVVAGEYEREVFARFVDQLVPGPSAPGN